MSKLQQNKLSRPAVEVLTETRPTPRGFRVCVETAEQKVVRVVLTSSPFGHQSTIIENDGGTLTIVCVGHVYEHDATTFAIEESLRKLLGIYAASGLQAMRDRIGGGIFALVLVDRTEGRLFAFTDMLSCMPFFYRYANNSLLIGTNQFDLAEGLEPSLLACAEYISYGYLPFHPSLFSELQRMGPGQVLQTQLDETREFAVTSESYPSYPANNQRISDESEACDRLNALFTRYYDRLDRGPISLGLSGGYDSRLIAAYCADKAPHLVTFGTPGSNEAVIAQRVAAGIGHNTKVYQVPADAPSRYWQDFFYGTATMDSLESSHVYANLNSLLQAHPAYLIDGFLGGEIVGSHYYYRISGGTEPLLSVLMARDSYQRGPQANSRYAKLLKTAYGRLRRCLTPGVASELQDYIRARLAMMLDSQRAYCHSDADMVELLSYRLRTNRLISGGPVTFLRRVATLVPFYDTEVFATCLGVSKSLRAGDRLYNALYRRRFPELAHIPKEGTGGRAAQTDRAYRMTHLLNSISKRMSRRLPDALRGSASGAGDDLNLLQSRYVACEANRKLFYRARARANKNNGINGVLERIVAHGRDEDPIVGLRMASLVLLSHNPESQQGLLAGKGD